MRWPRRAWRTGLRATCLWWWHGSGPMRRRRTTSRWDCRPRDAGSAGGSHSSCRGVRSRASVSFRWPSRSCSSLPPPREPNGAASAPALPYAARAHVSMAATAGSASPAWTTCVRGRTSTCASRSPTPSRRTRSCPSFAVSFAEPRLDGELRFPDGAAVAWREWEAWRAGRSRAVLVKRLDGCSLWRQGRSGSPAVDVEVAA